MLRNVTLIATSTSSKPIRTIIAIVAAAVVTIGIRARVQPRHAARHKPPPALSSVPPERKPQPTIAAQNLSRCYGTERASLGPLFGNLVLGRIGQRPELPPPDKLGLDISFDMSGQRVDGVVIGIRDKELCMQLENRLAETWGPPDDADARWLDSARDHGAIFERDPGNDMFDPAPRDSLAPSCTLRFFRLVAPELWLNRSRESVVPIWAIGRSAAELEAALAPRDAESQYDSRTHAPLSITWRDTSMGGDLVTLVAYLRGGRVTGIAVGAFDMDIFEVWRRIHALFGTPVFKPYEDSNRWRWRRKPGVEVSQYAGDAGGTGEPSINGWPMEIVFGVRPKYTGP